VFLGAGYVLIGAMAEFERSLIVERVRAGMRNARSKGKHLGRPQRSLDARRISAMRAQGLAWKKIAREIRQLSGHGEQSS
jgi:DNA invertase Pin-like site-specific DNA recombinase